MRASTVGSGGGGLLSRGLLAPPRCALVARGAGWTATASRPPPVRLAIPPATHEPTAVERDVGASLPAALPAALLMALLAMLLAALPAALPRLFRALRPRVSMLVMRSKTSA